MPIFGNSENEPTVPLLQEIANGINNLGASFASSLGGLGNLDFDFSTFSHTNLTSLELSADTPTLLVKREAIARRNTIKNAATSIGIILIVQGQDEPTLEEFLKTPWTLKPGEMKIDDRDGGYPIWGMTVGGPATIQIGLEYDKPPQSETELEKEIPMHIELILGSGKNVEDWSNRFYPPYDWTTQSSRGGFSTKSFRDIFTDGLTGYKIFQFKSFVPLKSYQVQVVASPEVVFKSDKPFPIDCYFISLEHLLKTAFYFGINPFSYSFSFEEKWKVIQDWIFVLQKLSWHSRFPAEGGVLNLTPDSGKYLGYFRIAAAGPKYMQIAVIDWEQEGDDTGTFIIKGY